MSMRMNSGSPRNCWWIAVGMLAAQAAAAELICFEAELANRIEPVMEIWEDAEASGGRAVVIRQGASGGQARPDANGKAVFRVPVPKAGRYRAWLRARWLDECSNSVELVPPGGVRFTITDTVFNRWHWVRSASFRLQEGHHTLELRNREDGIAVDQIILTPKNMRAPSGPVAPTLVPSLAGEDDADIDELEASVTAFCPNMPAKVSRRYDVRHQVMASGELPDFMPATCALPGQTPGLHVWLRNNLDRDIDGEVALQSCEGLTVAPALRQPFRVRANGLTKVPFLAVVSEGLPVAEHRLSFAIRSGGVVRRERVLLVRPLEWRIIGPFDNPSGAGLTRPHPPEHGIDLDATYPGKTGNVRWRFHPLPQTYSAFAFVDLQRLFGQTDWAAAYALSEIELDRDGEVMLTVMGDDMVRVWIDGREAATAGAALPATLNRRMQRVRLSKGRHRVLAKSCQGRNYWEFSVSFRPAPGQSVVVRGLPARVAGSGKPGARSEERGAGSK